MCSLTVSHMCIMHTDCLHPTLFHPPPVLADASPSLQISFSGSCLFILLSLPLSLTKDVCVTTGLELPDGALWAQQWAQLKTMIPTFSQNSSEANALAHGVRLCEPLPLKLCFLHEEKVKKIIKYLCISK